MTALGVIGGAVVSLYQEFIATLPFWIQNFLNLFFISLLFVIYGVLIWKFYRFIAHKDIIQLNLRQYNKKRNGEKSRFYTFLLYILEYIIILPFLVFFWFAMFTTFLIILTDNLELNTILIISATIIVAIRMTAYYKEDLAKDMAKLLPFTLLAVAITQSTSFSFSKILGQLFAIPILLQNITSYLLFVFIIEFILRLLETTFVASGMYNPDEAYKEDKE
ncbi:MAG: hypothetical protein PF542_02410 [Nanoarchaeota archaeon]|jgi:hypothetical protein|nr:hypothetical protein [Nanoarchaeota archaeon]